MQSNAAEALKKLKSTGVRMTPQRNAILTHLNLTMSHPTADEIYQELRPKFPHLSVATIYNNLKVFLEAGLVRELNYGDDASRFDANMDDHYHVTCQSCGKMVDFEFPNLHVVEEAAAQDTGFEIKGHRMEMYGTCKDCLH